MSEYLFKDMSEYDTPEGVPVSKLFLLTGKSRWYFYAYNFGIFIKSGIAGKKGKLDGDCQIRYSSGNIRLIERCGGRIHLRGLDHLRALNGRPVVLAGNHMSLLETAVLHAIIREHVNFSFVVKESLMHVPFFRGILEALNAIPVGRMNPREDLKAVLQEGKKRLECGQSMVIFPQAHRSAAFAPENFNSIAVKLAKYAGVPVVPFALKTDFVGNGKFLKDLGPLHPERDVWFDFGDPMEITGNGAEQQKALIDFIAPRVAAWNEQNTGVLRK